MTIETAQRTAIEFLNVKSINGESKYSIQIYI